MYILVSVCGDEKVKGARGTRKENKWLPNLPLYMYGMSFFSMKNKQNILMLYGFYLELKFKLTILEYL